MARSAPLRRAPLATLAVALLPALLPVCSAQSVYFEVLQYREPNQCERHQCLPTQLARCKDHLEGFYLKEKGCRDGMVCTKCTYGNHSEPTLCTCENPPYSIVAAYGQECNIGTVCGEGLCFRPCDTFLHVTLCPEGHCQWDRLSETCMPKVLGASMFMWAGVDDGTYVEQGGEIVESTPVSFYPISFDYFKAAAEGYRINGVLLINITSYENLFGLMDSDSSGGLSSAEFARLPDFLQNLASTTIRRLWDEEPEMSPEQRRLTAQVCGSQGKFYCSFDGACKDDCGQCGWKSAHDLAFSECTVPSPATCNADTRTNDEKGKVYCPTDELCKADGCSDCPGRPYVDFSQHKCLAKWWDPQPLASWENWVCRYRNKVGMPCVHDQDCISGLRRCLEGTCQPMEPYAVDHICERDTDCPHIGYYCPSDPTNGLNQYWVNYCRKQLGKDEYCSSDRDCQPEFRCNIVEMTPRCRRYFSLPIGTLATVDELCEFGWRDRNGRCAPAAKSKNVGGACDSDADCATTDATGRTGSCVCKSWWQDSDSKYCEPVAGDYTNHLEKYRNYVWFRVVNCGNHWSEEECLYVFGAEALALKYDFECEKQELSGGPFLPPDDCELPAGDARFVDACAKLAAAR